MKYCKSSKQMLIPWNIANQQENKCSLHAASKKDNSPPLRAVQCTVQSKLLFNFRVTMFNSLWPLCKIELVDSAFAQIIVIESRREFLRRPNLFSPAIIDYIVPNLARHVEQTGRFERDVYFFLFGFECQLQYQAQYLCETIDRGWMIKHCKRHSRPNHWVLWL